MKDEVNLLPTQVVPRVIAREFFKYPSRPSFVTDNDPINASRFNPTKAFFNYNTINKKTSKGDGALNIGLVSSRDENLI